MGEFGEAQIFPGALFFSAAAIQGTPERKRGKRKSSTVCGSGQGCCFAGWRNWGLEGLTSFAGGRDGTRAKTVQPSAFCRKPGKHFLT